jgi:6-pyruvoyltetrahydropterin/6-carboxytetrahydropterin synthase
MYLVAKDIHFCYGHRLMDYDGKCAHPHGHNGKIVISLEADKLDNRGMVFDFGDVKEIVQKWVDEKLDHKMILKSNDPLLEWLKKQNEPYFLMEQNPTAENLAKLVYDFAKSKKLPVKAVTFWESVSSSATYSE